MKKIGEADNEGAEPEYKFEWQRTWGHAPKESYLEKGDDYMEQPFGIQVGSLIGLVLYFVTEYFIPDLDPAMAFKSSGSGSYSFRYRVLF